MTAKHQYQMNRPAPALSGKELAEYEAIELYVLETVEGLGQSVEDFNIGWITGEVLVRRITPKMLERPEVDEILMELVAEGSYNN